MTGIVHSTEFIAKGYVFVELDSSQPRKRRSERAFLHRNDYKGEWGLLTAGAAVEFTLEQSDRGPRAVDARLI